MSLYDSIFIIGGGGMLGHALADALAARGCRALSPSHQELDITDRSALERSFGEHGPTLVFNCAAHTKVDLCEQESVKADAVNGHAVGALARLCGQRHACLVHVSTDFVFDGSQKRPYRVDDPPNPLGAYGRSKLLGEIELRKNAPQDWLMVRTAWVYGRHGANFSRTIVQAARTGKPLSVVNDQIGSPTYAPDLAKAIVDLLDSGARGIWHATNSGQTNWCELARATLDQFGIDAPVTPISSAHWAQMRPGSAPRPLYSVLDIDPLTRKIGRPMRDWRAALADYQRDVQAHGF